MRRRLRPRMTLRTRVTVAASLGITAAIVGGLLLLYQLQASSVRATIDDQLRTYATEVAQSAPDGQWSGPLPASTLDANAEAQVITADGQVLAATRTLTGLPAIYQLPASATSPVRQVAAEGVVPTDIRVVAQRFTVAGQQVTIVTGTGTALLETVDTEFLRLLLLGLPLILLLSAFAVWTVVGRSLGPVDRIRHAVEAITADDLSRRVPEPQTTDEIGQLARTMNAMLRRLDDSARTQRRFVADASHELRSPLAAIRTTLEVGLAHPETAPWPTIAHRAAQQSQRLEALIQQLLLLSWTTRPPTHGTQSRSTPRRPARPSPSPSTTTAQASPPPTATASSTASYDWTTAGNEAPVAPVSGWPSATRSRTPTTRPSPSPTAHTAAHDSPSSYPSRSTTRPKASPSNPCPEMTGNPRTSAVAGARRPGRRTKGHRLESRASPPSDRCCPLR